MKAWDTRYRRNVALKPLGRLRSRRRVRELIGVPPHPGVALARDEIVVSRRTYLAMEFVAGARLDPRTADASQLSDVEEALTHLHGQPRPVAHGAVRAANVIVADDGRAVLVNPALRRWPRPTPAGDRRAMWALRRRVLARRRGGARRAVAGITALLVVAGAAAAFTASDESPPRPATRKARGHSPSGLSRHEVASLPAATTPRVADIGAAVAPATDPVAAPVALTAARSRLGVYRSALQPLAKLQYPAAFDVYQLDDAVRPDFQRRTVGLTLLWTHVVTLGNGWLLWYRAVDGEVTTSPIEFDGRLGLGDFGIGKTAGWTHVAADGHGTALRYLAITGAIEALRFDDGFLASRHSGSLPAGYDRVLGLGAGRFLFYRAGTGEALVVTVADRTFWSDAITLPKGWSVLAVVGDGLLVGIDGFGRGQVRRIVDGVARAAQGFTVPPGNWDSAVGFDRGFVAYPSGGGASLLVPVAADGRVGAPRAWQLPARPLVAAVD